MTVRTARAFVVCFVTLIALWPSGCGRSADPASESAAPAPPPEVESGPGTAYPLTLKDDLGTEVTIKAAPQRIVSLSPPITETLFALGLSDRVAGVTSFCDYPPEAKDKEKVGGIIDPSEEKVVALQPDLVLATVGNPKPVLEAFARNGITVYAVDAERYDKVVENVRTLARICNVPEAGERVAGKMEDAAEEIKAKVSGIAEDKRPRALFVIWLDPLHVAGPGTYLDDMMKVCGAHNVAAETENPWKQYSVEMAVSADPDVLVIGAHQSVAPEDQESYIAELKANPQWATVSAVRSGRIGFIHSDLVSRTGPRLAEGLRQLAAILHPDLFPPDAREAAKNDRP